jgi:CheY-like chemotaxis protein
MRCNGFQFPISDFRLPASFVALFVMAWLAAAPRLCAQDDDAQAEAPKPAAAVKFMRSRAKDPTVKELLATEPKAPAELVQVADLLVGLGAMAEAAPLTARLAETELDEPAMAELAEQFGSATFLRFAIVDELQPDGRKFADAVLAAVNKKVRDPGRIASLIEQLKSPSVEMRHAAIVRLRAGRESALVALVSTLAKPGQNEHEHAIGTALVAFGREALPALVVLAREADGHLPARAIDILGRMEQADLAMDLMGPALIDHNPPEVKEAARRALVASIGRLPDVDEAVALLERRARAVYDRRRDTENDGEPPVSIWRWDADSSLLVSLPTSPQVAALEVAARWAGDAFELRRHHRAARRVFFGARLEAEALRADAPRPAGAGPAAAGDAGVEAELADLGVDVVEDLLEDAVKSGHLLAAASAARVLAKIGTADLLYRKQPRPSALVEAARHADRRVRYAALEAVVALKPSKPYPGSSYVPAALGYFAASSGAPRALIAHPRAGEAEQLAGLMAAVGYETHVATSDREVLAGATVSPDLELALVNFKLAAPTSGQLLERLRADSRTALLPIGIVSASDEWDRAERLARMFPPALVIIPTQDEARLAYQLGRLLAQAGRNAVGVEERNGQAAQALEWLNHLARVPQGLYNLRRIEPAVVTALGRPEHSPKAASVLAGLGTATSQKALADLASQSLLPLEVRRAAADAFNDSVLRFGTLLTTPQIALVYDRYNRSETQDRDTQRLLGSLLDAIEARAEVE